MCGNKVLLHHYWSDQTEANHLRSGMMIRLTTSIQSMDVVLR